MDIYILRDGKETGPFSEETTQSLLKQGAVLINDLAWQPGMANWIPLVQVLYPAAAAPTGGNPPPPPIPSQKADPATPKQKAFLSYVGTNFASNLTKDQAAILMTEAMESTSLHRRVTQWNDDRLKLHPDLFAAEIQSKKDNRANRFFEICQIEGSDHFTGVSKAHCQVLVGYLDVRFPNWDANETDASWNYFFPAVAEKFPQLVNKQWRGKLKYPDGPKVAAELVRRQPTAKVSAGGFPAVALVRGIVFGLGILLVLYIGQQVLKSDSRPAPATGPSVIAEDAGHENPVEAAPSLPPIEDAPTPAHAEIASTPPKPTDPLPTAKPPAAVAPDGAPMATSGSTPSNASLFDPAPAPPATSPVPGVDSSIPTPKTFVTLTKATEVQLPFGRAKLQPGTQLKLVSQDGTVVKAMYTNTVVVLPLSSTDLAETTNPQ